MLNYIWAGLIISSFLFAIGYDIRDISGDKYRNGRPLPVELAFPEGYDSAAQRVAVEIRIAPDQYASFYRTDQAPAPSYPGYSVADEGGNPAPLCSRVQAPRAARHDRESLEFTRRGAAGPADGIHSPAEGLPASCSSRSAS